MTTLAAKYGQTLAPSPLLRWPLVICGGLLLVLIHAFSLPSLALDDATPDMFTVAALFLALYAHRDGRYLPCLLLGLIRDCASVGLLGCYGVLYGLLWKFAGRLRVRLDPDNPINVMLIALPGIFLVNLGYHVTLSLSGDGIGWGRALMRCLTVALATSPVCVILFPLARAVLTSFGVQRVQGGYFNV